ncbi:MAG TPA: tRNA lysidine(34) synthetase TilS [Stellaceae bacterium]|nr:tRNA lysidine(34) synthetase TilS [Stellaceae bacterium]
MIAALAVSPVRHDERVASGFAASMARLAPFEMQPHLAVAVSGGGDSMALMLLADEWARARGGRITALTVDHGLRADAAAEAAQVAAWCAMRGIDHVVLRWTGAKPDSGLQAAARNARYALLESWCRDHAVLHLLLAHQREDQAETVKMRAARGSGLDGLAGMASVSERGAMRLLRPLLATPRAALRDFLLACGQPWIEDPSNRNPIYTRVRVRAALGAAAPGSSDANLAATATRLGHARAFEETEDARRLACALSLHPAGFAALDARAFAARDRLGLRALSAIIGVVSGDSYPPRRERLERLLRVLAAGLAQGRSLGGCLFLPRRGQILVCREPAAVAAPLPLAPGSDVLWDGRFRVSLDPGAAAGLWLGPLGADGPAIARQWPNSAAAAVPATVRATLPVLRDAKGVVAIPALGYFKCCSREAMTAACRAQFRPLRPLTGAGFAIV